MRRVNREDHIDGFLRRLEAQLPPDNGIDLDVEGLVDRINGISRRIKRGLEATLADFDLTPRVRLSTNINRLAHALRAPPRRRTPKLTGCVGG